MTEDQRARLNHARTCSEQTTNLMALIHEHLGLVPDDQGVIDCGEEFERELCLRGLHWIYGHLDNMAQDAYCEVMELELEERAQSARLG